jgi:hypothetical protein
MPFVPKWAGLLFRPAYGFELRPLGFTLLVRALCPRLFLVLGERRNELAAKSRDVWDNATPDRVKRTRKRLEPVSGKTTTML